ncbi:MAG: TIGR03905 family TSCPD domain-containing protein [Oscillospiraceae bacterium]|nr:TIGR03905 family TSCPD domain-containing protein [Oscillospiraceae bacterium]
MAYQHSNKGVCSISTEVQLNEDGTIGSITVLGGCNGNLKGLSALLKGMPAEEAIRKLEGITCGARKTSCPDQIAKALGEALKAQARQ